MPYFCATRLAGVPGAIFRWRFCTAWPLATACRSRSCIHTILSCSGRLSRWHPTFSSAGSGPTERVKRILVIRGGAIGDFILTLPALKALRELIPRHTSRFWVTDTSPRSPKIGFMRKRSIPSNTGRFPAFSFQQFWICSPELADYFSSFDLIISYLYDPDEIFENNLRRCGVAKNFARTREDRQFCHAARQLGAPMEQLGSDSGRFVAARLFLSYAGSAIRRRTSCAICRGQFWRFILAAAAKKKLADRKLDRAWQRAPAFQASWLFPAKRMRRRSRRWKVPGTIATCVSRRICRCLSLPQFWRIRSLLATTVAFRTWPPPPAPLPFTFWPERSSDLGATERKCAGASRARWKFATARRRSCSLGARKIMS